MQLSGAEKGRVQLMSAPIDVAVADGSLGASVKSARLVWVPPKVEAVCRAAAGFYLGQLYGRAFAREDLEAEQRLLMMSWALREDDGLWKTQVFAFPALMDDKNRLVEKDEILYQSLHDAAIRSSCVDPAALWSAYEDFRLAEFPPFPTAEQERELFEEAKKNTMLTLLSKHGWWKLLRALRGMERQLGGYAPLSTTDGRP